MVTETQISHHDRRRDLTLPNTMPQEFDDTSIPPTAIRGLIFVLAIMGLGLFAGLGWWATEASIQGAVVATGTFEVEGDLQVVDHLEGGVVQEIFVADGQTVEAGDPILQLDPVHRT